MAEPITLKEINPPDPLPPPDAAAEAAIAALARRQHGAAGLMMKAVTLLGGQVEDTLKLLPKPAREAVEAAARAALAQSYAAAARTRTGALAGRLTSDVAHRRLAALSGALGGLGGLPTALAELPVATTVIFRAVQRVAEEHGEDPAAEETRLHCLQVFGAGGPGTGDEGIDTTFLGARLAFTGPALQALIARVAPRFAAVIGLRLGGAAVPLLGAAAGAGMNWAFTRYYVEVAHVHFGLRALVRAHGEGPVLDRFHAELARLSRPVLRA